MLKRIRVFFLVVALCFVFAPPAKAIDPVTLAILAPIAVRGAKMAAPYVLRGSSNILRNGGRFLRDIGQLLRLPLGIIQALFLWPWGSFRSGIVNILRGLVAPFKLVFHVLMLPLYMFGINSNF